MKRRHAWQERKGVTKVRLLVIMLAALPASLYGLRAYAEEAQRQPTFEEIGNIYRQHRQAFTSILAEYRIQGERLVEKKDADPKKPKRPEKPKTSEAMTTVCQKGGKFYYRNGASRRGQPGQYLVNERVVVYDGTTMWDKRPMRDRPLVPYVLISEPGPSKGKEVSLTYFDLVCLPYEESVFKGFGSLELRDHIPGMFEKVSFSIAPEREKVDGADCIVLSAPKEQWLDPADGADCIVPSAPKWQRLWLDPALGFAVKKREIWSKDVVNHVWECRKHERVAGNLWLPREIEGYFLGGADDPAPLRGQKLRKEVFQIIRLEVDKDVHDSLFAVDIDPGYKVNDQRLKPVAEGRGTRGSDGKGYGVTYVQPANPADLEKAILEAQGIVSPMDRWAQWLRWGILGCGAVLLGVAVSLLMRWHRRMAGT